MTDRIAQQYYEKYWQEGLADWSPVGVAISPFEQEFLARWLRPGAKVLDFGCGDGSHAAPFAQSRQCAYTGVDVSEHAVALCRAKGFEAARYSPDAALPFDSAWFDNVLSFEVFEHLFDPEGALREIFRVLAPQGALVGSVPNSVCLANRALMVSGRFSPGGSPATSLKAPWKDPHIRFFSKRTLLALLEQAGFSECRVLGAEFSFLDLPVMYRSQGVSKRLISAGSWPFARFGKWWPSLFSPRLYFTGRK